MQDRYKDTVLDDIDANPDDDDYGMEDGQSYDNIAR